MYFYILQHVDMELFEALRKDPWHPRHLRPRQVTGLKSESLPMQKVFSAALGPTEHLRCLEDNTTAISVAE